MVFQNIFTQKHLQSPASNLKASPTGGGWRGPLFLLFLAIPSFLNAQTDSTAVSPLQGEVGRGLSVRLLNEVVVTGSRTTTDLRHLPMTVTVIGSETLREHERPNLMTTVAEQVPGLFLTQRGMMGFGVSGGGSGSLSMRGMAGGSGRMMVLVDGHPQYNGIYGHPISDAYLTTMADRVEVVRGPASVIYGSNAMGGVINIVSRGMQTDGMRTNIGLAAGSWGTIQADATNQYQSGRFSSTVGLQFGRSDNHRPHMGFTQYGGHVQLGYRIDPHWRASLNADLMHFSASQPGSTDAPMLEADQWITRGVAELALRNRYENTQGGISLYYNFGRHKINDGYNALSGSPQTELFRSSDALAGVSLYQSMSLFSGNNLTLGLDYQHIYGHAWYTSRETGETVTTGRRGMQSCKESNNEWAGYIDMHQDLLSWLTLNAGIRLDHHSQSGSEWVPQFGLVARPVSTGAIKAMVSKGFRNPTTREMYLYGTANDRLRAERLWNYELSWSQSLHRVSYSLTAYRLKASNLIETRQITDAEGNAVTRNVNTGHIDNWGIEGDLTWMVTKNLHINTNHSYLHMKHPLQSAPEYKGYLGLRWTPQRWTISGGLTQLSGLYTSDTHKENATLLNATVAYSVSPLLRLWVKGDNLLAQRYQLVEGYPMPRATFMAGVRLSF